MQNLQHMSCATNERHVRKANTTHLLLIDKLSTGSSTNIITYPPDFPSFQVSYPNEQKLCPRYDSLTEKCRKVLNSNQRPQPNGWAFVLKRF